MLRTETQKFPFITFFPSQCEKNPQSNLLPTIFSNISKKYLKYEYSFFTAIALVHATIIFHLGFCNSLLMNLFDSIVAHSAGKWFICISHYINPLCKITNRLKPHSEKSPNALLWSVRLYDLDTAYLSDILLSQPLSSCPATLAFGQFCKHV